MKYFYIVAIIATICIISLYSYQQNLFSYTKLPYDAEQKQLDQQIIIHFSHVVAENTPKGMAAAKFAELVKEKTDGKVVVQVYPNGILYQDETEIEALKNNDIQMIAPTFSKLTTLDEAWGVLDLPFVIETNDELYAALNSSLQSELFKTIQRYDMKGLQFWNNGFKQIASNKGVIKQLEDFDSLSIRIMNSKPLQKQFTLLGAKPISTTFDDVFNELENNAIQAQDNTLSNIYSKGFHNFEKDITMSNHGVLGYAVIVNDTFWSSLAPEYQQALTESLQEMQQWQFEHAIASNEEAFEKLRAEEHITLYELSNETKLAWQQKMQPMTEQWASNHYYKLLIDSINK